MFYWEFLALATAFLVRATIWLCTRGWPFGAGLLAYGFVSGGFYAPQAVGIAAGVIVTAGCLAIRFKLRHPEAAKAWVEHFRSILKKEK